MRFESMDNKMTAKKTDLTDAVYADKTNRVPSTVAVLDKRRNRSVLSQTFSSDVIVRF